MLRLFPCMRSCRVLSQNCVSAANFQNEAFFHNSIPCQKQLANRSSLFTDQVVEILNVEEQINDELVYNSLMEENNIPLLKYRRKSLKIIKQDLDREDEESDSNPVIYSLDNSHADDLNSTSHNSDHDENVQYPYSQFLDFKLKDYKNIGNSHIEDYGEEDPSIVREDICDRLSGFNKGELEPVNIEETLNLQNAGNREVQIARRLLTNEHEESTEEVENKAAKFGSADLSVPASNVPCGGCGALLHCRDPAIPGKFEIIISY